MAVLIYNDVGTTRSSVAGFLQEFQNIVFQGTTVRTTSSEELKRDGWQRTTHLLVFGAGEPTKWTKSLGEKGCSNIFNFINSGGNYLGCCAGAFFASATSVFHELNKEPISRDREIYVFPGKATGPLNRLENYKDPLASSAELVTFHFSEEVLGGIALDYQEEIVEGSVFRDYNPLTLTGRLYIQGGCHFECRDATTSKIAGSYGEPHQGKAAAVLCRIGDGRAWLMGPHIEYPPPPLEGTKIEHLKSLALSLAEHEEFRKKIFLLVSSILGVPLARKGS